MTQNLPYLPKGKKILYVKKDNVFMQEAQKVAEEFSLDPGFKTGAVIVKNGEIIGKGANGSEVHEKFGCERKKRNIPTGEGYDLCEGCHPKNHAEQSAILDVQRKNLETQNADLYLWGHFWCCESCWDAMIKAGIKNVYLPENAVELFKKTLKK